MVSITVAIICFTSTAYSAVSYSAGLDYPSAYVFKGATYNDDIVVQPWAEATIDAVTVGVWANYDMFGYNFTIPDNHISEVDIYASYAVPVELIDYVFTYNLFHYPDYVDEHEVAVSATCRKLIGTPCLTAKYGIAGGIEDDLYLDAKVSKSYTLTHKEDTFTLPISALVAYKNPSKGASGFSHYELSAGLNTKIGEKVTLGYEYTYIGSIDEAVLPRTGEYGGYDVKSLNNVYLSIKF